MARREGPEKGVVPTRTLRALTNRLAVKEDERL